MSLQHLVVSEYGTFLGSSGNRVIIHHGDNIIAERSLNRIKSITITKNGVSFSSDLLTKLAFKNIKLFLTDFTGVPYVSLYGASTHATVKVRQKQFEAYDKDISMIVARSIIIGKLKNQRAVLLYYSKYEKHDTYVLKQSAKIIESIVDNLSEVYHEDPATMRQLIMGYEGSAARVYWSALLNAKLLPISFINRVARGTDEITNKALNYAYAIIMSPIYNAIINAGLEPYLGVLHAERSGKPSLVLDLMEEYRAWVADRAIISIRQKLLNQQTLTSEIKKEIIAFIYKTLAKKYQYHGKHIKLETIIQRQVYRLVSTFYGEKTYKPYTFKW